jgi:hypothetical protein|mmetsp:Transcript_97300/g.163653  ORF Transcript_97300/g.163653 Transcript_97300/m.163653 type:complete len:113 (-) Transcript_97300:1156-1494(-)
MLLLALSDPKEPKLSHELPHDRPKEDERSMLLNAMSATVGMLSALLGREGRGDLNEAAPTPADVVGLKGAAGLGGLGGGEGRTLADAGAAARAAEVVGLRGAADFKGLAAGE